MLGLGWMLAQIGWGSVLVYLVLHAQPPPLRPHLAGAVRRFGEGGFAGLGRLPTFTARPCLAKVNLGYPTHTHVNK
ncbi:hypothetical protein [Streptosporangium sp. CA-115845]|uniref:hypothetical protein n=1 Tax=Streptosporangium sp. CA-115845 TaxID=3240071 RepID=UPI003D8F22AA